MSKKPTMTDSALFGLIFIPTMLFLFMFPFTICAPYSSIRTLYRCDCKHKREHHIIKIIGYDAIEGINCIKCCRICQCLCEEYGLKRIPNIDLRQEYLPKFQEMEYELEHPKLRKINIRF